MNTILNLDFIFKKSYKRPRYLILVPKSLNLISIFDIY